MDTSQKLQQEYEYAKAKALAEQEQNSALETEINSQGKQPPKPELPAQTYQSDKVLPDSTPGIVRAGVHTAENIVNPTPMLEGLGRGAVNAGVGALQTANAVGHSIGSSLGRAYDSYAPSVGLSPRDPKSVGAAQDQSDREQKMFQDATLQPRTQEETVSMPVGKVAATVAAGGGVGAGVMKAATPIVGKTAGYLAGGLAGSTVASAPFPENEGLLVSSHGYVGFPIKPEDPPDMQQSKKFMNQALDNMVLGVAGHGAYMLGAKGVEVATNLGRYINVWGKLSAIQQQAGEDIISIFGQLGEHPTAKQQQAAGQKVQELIDRNGIETYDFGAGVGNKTVKKDSISSITAELNDSNPFDRAVKTRMEALRSSAKRGNAPQTAVALEEPERVLNQGLQETQAVRGGDQAINQTKQVLQDRAMTEAHATDLPVRNAKNDLAKESSDFTSTLKNDPTFGPAIKTAEQGGVPLNINAKEMDLKNQIVNKAGAAQDTDKAVRDAAYQAVADSGAPAKMDEFTSIYEKGKDAVPDNIKKLIEKADGSYGYLYKNVRPALSKAMKTASNPNNYNGDALDSLGALKRNIDNDQVAWLTENGNEQTIAAAKSAAKTNAEYSAKWNDTIGKELRVNKNNNTWAPGTLQEQGRTLVDNAISNPNRKESIDNLKNILGPQDEGLVADTALAKATKDITAGKGTNIDTVTSDLQTMANSFGPQQKARLEGFLTDLKSKKITIEDLKTRIPELEKAAETEKADIFGQRFPTLFENAGGKNLPKERGYEVFESAMNTEQPRVLNALITEAKKNPGDISGIETAWLKSAEKRINSNPKAVGQLDERFVEYGKKIFGDSSPELKAITALRDSADNLKQSLNRPGMEGLSATDNQTHLRTALSTVQTWIFGVLNPTAARVRTITSNIADNYNSTSTAHKAIDNILSDNQALRDAATELIRKSKNQISPAQWKTLWTTGARLGLYDLKGQTDLNFNK